MKFAGKRRKSTEGVTLSGAGHTGATVNGSTLWRRPDPIFIARYFSVILHALDVYIERKIED